jgi:hypothetical protein
MSANNSSRLARAFAVKVPGLTLSKQSAVCLLNRWAIGGVCVENTSTKNQIHVSFFVMPIFTDNALAIELTYGDRVRNGSTSAWNISTPELVEACVGTCAEQLTVWLSRFRDELTFLKFLISENKALNNLNTVEAAYLASCLSGEVQSAAQALQFARQKLTSQVTWERAAAERIISYDTQNMVAFVDTLAANSQAFLRRFYPSLVAP